jgi:hypothetical protein
LYTSSTAWNVGIGTTSPGEKLTVTGGRIGQLESGTYGDCWGKWAAIGVPNLGCNPTNLNYYGLKLQWDSDAVVFGLKDYGSNRKDAIISWGDDSNDNLRFLSPVDTDAMIITGTGNVGIGTTDLGTNKLKVAGNAEITDNLTVGGTARIRPPLGYKSTVVSYEIPNSSEGNWIDDPMGSVSVTISGPSTLWIVYRGRIYAKDYSCGQFNGCCNAHSYGYSKVSVNDVDQEASLFAWEVSTGEGDTGERGFISTAILDVTCASYPCTKTIKGRIYVKDGNCPCVWPGWCDVRQVLVQRNLFVEAFKW